MTGLGATDAVIVATDGGARRTLTGELKVKMPFVGGKVERAIVGGLEENAAFTVKDELSGESYPWRGARNFVMLDPNKAPAHVFSIHPA